MKDKNNTSKKESLPNKEILINNENKNQWTTKRVDGALRYINDKPISKTSKINTIMQYKINAQDSETFSLDIDERRTELDNQKWSREKSQQLAKSEGIALNDGHWAVINYLRSHYLQQGIPKYARSLSRELGKEFAGEGGSKYLRNLFPRGPITQGSRLANLRTPPNATDVSFGTSY